MLAVVDKFKATRNEYNSRLGILRETLEDGKEILRDTLYQDAIKKNDKSTDFKEYLDNKIKVALKYM